MAKRKRLIREMELYSHTVTCGKCRPLEQYHWRGRVLRHERYYCRKCDSLMLVVENKVVSENEDQQADVAHGVQP